MTPLAFLASKKSYSPKQFAYLRIALGGYLAYYFYRMLPYATEVYGSGGAVPSIHLNWTDGYFPNILALSSSPNAILAVHLCAIALSLMVLVGFQRRGASLGVWYLWACLFNRNVLTGDPSLPFIGWLLLAFVLIPSGEPLSLFSRKPEREWYMPALVYWGAWMVLATAYTVSGIDRLRSVTWRDGLAMKYLLQLPIARTWVGTYLQTLPTVVFKIQSWLAVGTFVFALPASLFKQTRPFIWVLLTGAFVFAFLVLDLNQVLFGVFLFHAFLFDVAWVKKTKAPG